MPMTSQPDKLRPSRLSDMKKAAKEGEAWLPSVTTIQNILAKHALINWLIEQHLITTWKHLDVLCGTFSCDEDRITETKRLTELQMDKAPDAGSDFHDSMDKYIQDLLSPEHKHYKLCSTASLRIYKETIVNPPAWRPEEKFVSGAGYGGQVDLSNGDDWIIDYKTKQTAAKFKPGKMVYSDHTMQLAAYRMGLGLPTARCANLFVCLEDGQMDFHEHAENDLQKGWRKFQHALAIWQEDNL